MRELTRVRVRGGGAILGIASLVAYLILPLAHSLSVGAGPATEPRAGSVIEESTAGHSPLECPICDRIGHARHGWTLPVVSLALGALPVARADALPRYRASEAPRLDTAPARAPPASSLFS